MLSVLLQFPTLSLHSPIFPIAVQTKFRTWFCLFLYPQKSDGRENDEKNMSEGPKLLCSTRNSLDSQTFKALTYFDRMKGIPTQENWDKCFP